MADDYGPCSPNYGLVWGVEASDFEAIWLSREGFSDGYVYVEAAVQAKHKVGETSEGTRVTYTEPQYVGRRIVAI